MCGVGDDLVPQHARFHDIVLLHRADLVGAGARQLEGDAGDALDLERVVDLRVDAALLAVAQIDDLLGLAEIDAAGQFADDQDVEALDDFRLQRRGGGQRRIADGRAQIGEQRHVLAQAQQPGLGANLVGNTIPFRSADGTKQHRIGGHRLLHVGIGDRLAVGVIGGTADKAFVDDEAGILVVVHVGDQLADFGHRLRADAVAWKQEKGTCRHYVGFRCLNTGVLLLTGSCAGKCRNR